jgi:hypothetical protein
VELDRLGLWLYGGEVTYACPTKKRGLNRRRQDRPWGFRGHASPYSVLMPDTELALPLFRLKVTAVGWCGSWSCDTSLQCCRLLKREPEQSLLLASRARLAVTSRTSLLSISVTKPMTRREVPSRKSRLQKSPKSPSTGAFCFRLQGPRSPVYPLPSLRGLDSPPTGPKDVTPHAGAAVQSPSSARGIRKRSSGGLFKWKKRAGAGEVGVDSDQELLPPNASSSTRGSSFDSTNAMSPFSTGGAPAAETNGSILSRRNLEVGSSSGRWIRRRSQSISAELLYPADPLTASFPLSPLVAPLQSSSVPVEGLRVSSARLC